MDLENLEIITGTGEILEDYSSTGKRRKWEEKKRANEKLYKLYAAGNEKYDGDLIPEKSLEVVRKCGNQLTFALDREGNKSLILANFCRDKLCGMCNWRKSLKMFTQISKLTEKMLEENKVEFLFLTLTIRNVKAQDLSDTITQLLRAYKYCVQPSQTFAPAKRLKQSLLGSMRAMEITYNSDADTYHPHIHAILAVKPSYFSRGYMSKDEMIDMWKRAIKVDYRPSIDIRRIDNNAKAIAETAKYPIKMHDVLYLPDMDQAIDAIYTLRTATYKRHMIGFYGIFKDYRKKLQMDDVENGDLIHVEEDANRLNAVAKIVFWWDMKLGTYIC